MKENIMDIDQIVETLKNLAQDSANQLAIWWQALIVWVAQQFATFATLLEGWGVPAQDSLRMAYLIAYVVLGLLLLMCLWRLISLRRKGRKRSDRKVEKELELKRKGARSEAPTEAEASRVRSGGAEQESEYATEKLEAQPDETPELSVYERMRKGLARTHKSLFGKLDTILGGASKVDADTLEEIEEVLVSADFGVKTTQQLVDSLQARLSRGEMQQPEQVRMALREEILAIFASRDYIQDTGAYKPFVMMVVGVNGVGKTTTIGKLAYQYKKQGKRVLLGAGDTFRAAAADQLVAWGERADVTVVRHAEGADPAAVAFDSAKAAVAREADVLIVDTAGRLHTKVNLMEEMKKSAAYWSVR